MNLPRVEYEDIISDRAILNKDLSLKISDKKGTMFLPKDILFGKLRPYLNKWLHSNFKGIAVGDFWILRSKEVESKFIFYMLQTNQFKLISNISSGSKMPRSDWNIVSNSTFAVPLKSSEDRKIGLLLSTIENSITLHQRKINILKEMNRIFLEKIFSIDEFSHPDIRFIGYTSKWKNSKIKNYLLERNERSSNGELISVTIDSGVLKTESLNRKNNSSDDKSNYKIVRQGDIPYNSMRMWQGASGLSRFNGILSPAYTVLIPNENASGLYFSYLFKSRYMLNQFQKYSQGLTSDTWNLKYPLLKDIKINVPELTEQQTIGNFFSGIDKNIHHHQKKVRTLYKLKELYLHKMFL